MLASKRRAWWFIMMALSLQLPLIAHAEQPSISATAKVTPVIVENLATEPIPVTGTVKTGIPFYQLWNVPAAVPMPCQTFTQQLSDLATIEYIYVKETSNPTDNVVLSIGSPLYGNEHIYFTLVQATSEPGVFYFKEQVKLLVGSPGFEFKICRTNVSSAEAVNNPMTVSIYLYGTKHPE